jgi:hypothetical protein
MVVRREEAMAVAGVWAEAVAKARDPVRARAGALIEAGDWAVAVVPMQSIVPGLDARLQMPLLPPRLATLPQDLAHPWHQVAPESRT